jgi:hypothetical protein
MSNKSKIISISLLITGVCCLVTLIVFLGIGGLYSYLGSPFLGITDCGWDDTAIAWIDENENGVWENNERPLPGVQFIADDIQHDYDTSNEAISGANGEAWVSVFPVDCDGFEFVKIVIQAVPPEGYQSTTPDQILVAEAAIQNAENDNLLFGFIRKE